MKIYSMAAKPIVCIANHANIANESNIVTCGPQCSMFPLL